MQRSIHLSFYCRAASLALLFAGIAIYPQTPPRGIRAGAHVAATTGAPSASLQSLRNVGKAYFEQGKYVEAIEQFQKVVASGKALATDHLNLGLALMEANQLDAALGEMTTAKQMDPHLVAADYCLGILYKRELRNPDAEAALRRVIRRRFRRSGRLVQPGNRIFCRKETGRIAGRVSPRDRDGLRPRPELLCRRAVPHVYGAGAH